MQNPFNIQFPNPGTYTVSLTVLNSAGSNGVTQTITVNPLPTATITVTPSFADQSTGSAILTPGGGESPYTITWATTPSQTGPVVSNLAPGDYLVTVTDNNNFMSTSSFTIEGNAYINASEPFALILFPNPIENVVTVTAPAEEYQYQLIDAAGRIVLNGQFAGESITLPAEQLAPGLYTFRISNKRGQVVRKLLKNSL